MITAKDTAVLLSWANKPTSTCGWLIEKHWQRGIEDMVCELALESEALPYKNSYDWEFVEHSRQYVIAGGHLRLRRKGRHFDEMGGYIEHGKTAEWQFERNVNGVWKDRALTDADHEYLAALIMIAFGDVVSDEPEFYTHKELLCRLDQWFIASHGPAKDLAMPVVPKTPQPQSIDEKMASAWASAHAHDAKLADESTRHTIAVGAIAVAAVLVLMVILALVAAS